MSVRHSICTLSTAAAAAGKSGGSGGDIDADTSGDIGGRAAGGAVEPRVQVGFSKAMGCEAALAAMSILLPNEAKMVSDLANWARRNQDDENVLDGDQDGLWSSPGNPR